MTRGLTAVTLSKRYGNTQALDSVSVTLHPGEVHGLMGHNGAGKSTLLKILTGAERPDSGSVVIDGEQVRLLSPAHAHAHGVVGVYQELALIGNLTVAENLFLGHEQLQGPKLNRRAMRRTAAELLDRYDVAASADDVVNDLPVATRQMIEVASALHRRSRYILLDEPTTALDPSQVEQLLSRLRDIARSDDVGFALVDHRLDEVYSVADRVTALTDGRVVVTGTAVEVPRAKLTEAIIGDRGRDTAVEPAPVTSVPGDSVSGDSVSGDSVSGDSVSGDSVSGDSVSGNDVLLSVTGLSGPRLRHVDLTVRKGRVLGLYGLVGAGRTRILRTLFGIESDVRDTVRLVGQQYRPRSAADAIRQGVAFLSEERKHDGLVPGFPAAWNVSLPVLNRFTRAAVLRRAALAAAADEALEQVHVRGDITQPIERLSGGNQQKSLLARALIQNPRVLLLDEPTRGIDIGTKVEIHALVRRMAHERGAGVVVVSSDEEELLAISDDVVVVRGGATVSEPLPTAELSVKDLRLLALPPDTAEAAPASEPGDQPPHPTTVGATSRETA